MSKVAIVVDWLVTYAGAERVLEQMLACFPDADIFAVVDFLPKDQRQCVLDKPVKTSFIQRLPFAKKYYRHYLPLMPLAIEQLDVSAYDLVISSSHAVAKGIITGPDQRHICYIHSPIRYAWDLQHQYLQEAGLSWGLRSLIIRYFLHKIRLWDVRTALGVDAFIANSHYIAKRVWKVYHRQAEVVYPPVAIERCQSAAEKSDFYVTVGRMVPYKRIQMIVQAFNQMPDKKLKIIGEGPDFEKIKSSITSPNIELLGFLSSEIMHQILGEARAFVYAACEDFGIVMVEALASGTPVIAYGKGGAAEIVTDNTGLLYLEQTADALVAAVKQFEQGDQLFTAQDCQLRAKRFSQTQFTQAFMNAIHGE